MKSSILSFFFLKDHHLSKETKTKFNNWFPYLFWVWILALVTVPQFIIGNDILFVVGCAILALFHWCFLVFVSLFASKSWFYLIIFIPMTICFIFNVFYWNIPTYYGALDGFANIINTMIQFFIIFTFPTFLFLLRMLPLKSKIRGVLLIIFTFLAFVLGLNSSIGKNGFLSDRTGEGFAILVLLSFGMGFYLYLKDNRNCAKCK